MELRKINKRGGVAELITGIPALVLIAVIFLLFAFGSSIYEMVGKGSDGTQLKYDFFIGAGDIAGYVDEKVENSFPRLVQKRFLLAKGESLREVFVDG